MKGLGDSLYHNNGDGTFTEVSKSAGVDDAAGRYGLGLTWSDFNDDGRPDLFVADDSTPNYLYRNDGNGHFTNVSFSSGTAVAGDGGEMAGMGVAVCDYDHTWPLLHSRYQLRRSEQHSLSQRRKHELYRCFLSRRDRNGYGPLSWLGHGMRGSR